MYYMRWVTIFVSSDGATRQQFFHGSLGADEALYTIDAASSAEYLNVGVAVRDGGTTSVCFSASAAVLTVRNRMVL